MPDQHHPLLLFPTPAAADRSRPPGGGAKVTGPSGARQGVRLAPRFSALQAALAAERLRLQQVAAAENPEFVVVFETIGTVERFANAVARIAGLEWLFESALEQISPDEDFFVEGKPQKLLSGRLFLLGSNQQALEQVLSLWEQFRNDPLATFPRGLAPLKHVFEQLRDVRRWSVQDRIGVDVKAYWSNEIAAGPQSVRFEVEAWCYRSAARNDEVRVKIEGLVQKEGGQVLSRALIPEIAYHGFLVELPVPSITRLLAGEEPDIVISDQVMFFRPRAQSIAAAQPPGEASAAPAVGGAALRDPVVALLDGFPLQNHSLLAGRVVIDDPDEWEATYEAKDRVHGTAMASLIVHGELDNVTQPLDRRIYVRPILRPDPADGRPRRSERTPTNVLLIDLIHRAVRRICEGDGNQAAVAPSVRIINLSVGDDSRVFERELSPWARLLDWLAFRYRLLFVVSSGNSSGRLRLAVPSGALSGLTDEERRNRALEALVRSDVDRRLIAPAEAMNALTVGALHVDGSQPPANPNRFDLFNNQGPSPYSRVGHGFRRAVKPDILMPGGRILHREQPVGPDDATDVETVDLVAAPGHRVAAPPAQGLPNATEYCRGTSNSAALASRAAAQAFEVVEAMRAGEPNALPPRFDAVLIKALLAHGASWGNLCDRLLAVRPDITDWRQQREFVARWLGYGPVDLVRGLTCTDQRATLVGVGELGQDEALVFESPLPPSLSAQPIKRRLVVTLAWVSPTNAAHQAYRYARLWISPPHEDLRVKRTECVHDHAQRGTLQHDILEGDEAVAFGDGTRIQIKVNCSADAGDFEVKIPFALCVSLEVPVETGIAVYQEVRARIAPAVPIRPAG
jgi:hypothetical protein